MVLKWLEQALRIKLKDLLLTVCKQPIIAHHFEFENELKFYNFEARINTHDLVSTSLFLRFNEKYINSYLTKQQLAVVNLKYTCVGF